MSPAPKAGAIRMSADERRIDVVRAALSEFAVGGLHGTSTTAIARQVGVSQPYLFRLFPTKKALFLAAAELCFARIAGCFTAAAEGLRGHEAMHSMGRAYTEMVSTDRETLLMEMQLFVASAQDEEIQQFVRTAWDELEVVLRAASGAGDEEVVAFMAMGMMCNTIAALDLPVDRYDIGPKAHDVDPDCRLCTEQNE
jgi:AcrR family transcriptional regulator